MLKNNLRVWGVWDRVIGRIEYLSESQNACRQFMKLLEQAHRTGFELLRFDLCPLYYDSDRLSPRQCYAPAGGFKSSLPREGRTNKTQTQVK